MGAERVGFWLIGLLLLTSCATRGAVFGPPLGPNGDIDVAEGPEGWLKLSPLACEVGARETSPSDQRRCTGRIDLNGDGRMEIITQLYVGGMPSLISVRSDAPSQQPLFEDEGYSLLVRMERFENGWPMMAAFGHGSTAELRVGVSHRWRRGRFEPID